MLSIETERRLKYFFDDVRQGEEYQEIKRQRLCQNPEFAPYSAFMRIDRNANESLSPFEIAAFLRDNKEYTVTESDCSLFVNYYD